MKDSVTFERNRLIHNTDHCALVKQPFLLSCPEPEVGKVTVHCNRHNLQTNRTQRNVVNTVRVRLIKSPSFVSVAIKDPLNHAKQIDWLSPYGKDMKRTYLLALNALSHALSSDFGNTKTTANEAAGRFQRAAEKCSFL